MQTRTLIFILLALIVSYLLLGPLPYLGPVTELGIVDGPDLNVPYQTRFGLLTYATTQDYYENFQVVERRFENFNPFRLGISLGLILIVYAALMTPILRDRQKHLS